RVWDGNAWVGAQQEAKGWLADRFRVFGDTRLAFDRAYRRWDGLGGELPDTAVERVFEDFHAQVRAAFGENLGDLPAGGYGRGLGGELEAQAFYRRLDVLEEELWGRFGHEEGLASSLPQAGRAFDELVGGWKQGTGRFDVSDATVARMADEFREDWIAGY